MHTKVKSKHTNTRHAHIQDTHRAYTQMTDTYTHKSEKQTYTHKTHTEHLPRGLALGGEARLVESERLDCRRRSSTSEKGAGKCS